MTAAARIRDSIAALPEEERDGSWYAMRGTVRVRTVGGDEWPVASVNEDIPAVEPVAAHIALMASPHVGEALANLLEARRAETLALATWVARQIPEDHARLVDAQHALTRAFAALEAAINREASGSDENTPPTAPDAPRNADGRGYGSQAGREADGATGGQE